MRALLLVVGLHLVVFGGQQALLHRKQQVEHAAGAAVAVGEGVDGFELGVRDGDLGECGHVGAAGEVE